MFALILKGLHGECSRKVFVWVAVPASDNAGTWHPAASQRLLIVVPGNLFDRHTCTSGVPL